MRPAVPHSRELHRQPCTAQARRSGARHAGDGAGGGGGQAAARPRTAALESHGARRERVRSARVFRPPAAVGADRRPAIRHFGQDRPLRRRHHGAAPPRGACQHGRGWRHAVDRTRMAADARGRRRRVAGHHGAGAVGDPVASRMARSGAAQARRLARVRRGAARNPNPRRNAAGQASRAPRLRRTPRAPARHGLEQAGSPGTPGTGAYRRRQIARGDARRLRLSADQFANTGAGRDRRRSRSPSAHAAPPARRRRCRQDAGRHHGHAARRGSRRPGRDDGADGNPRAPAFPHPLTHLPGAGGAADRIGERGLTAQRAARAAERPHSARRRHARTIPRGRRLPRPRTRHHRRTAPLRRRAAPLDGIQGPRHGRAGDDGHAHSAHPPAHPMGRNGSQPTHRKTRWPHADTHLVAFHRHHGRRHRRHRPRAGPWRPGVLGLPAGQRKRTARRGRRGGALRHPEIPLRSRR